MGTQLAPVLGWGEGSWGWDAARGKITLRHRWAGRSHIERGDTHQECLERRNRRRRDLDVRANLVGDTTLGSVADAWLTFQKQGHAELTNMAYRTSVAHFVRELGADADLVTIDTGQVEDLWSALAARGLGRASIDKRRGHWTSLLDFAVRRNLMPAARRLALRDAICPPIAPTVRRNTWHALDAYRTVRAFLAERAEGRDLLYLTMMLCGLRPGEAMGLKWTYVDLPARSLRVEGTIKRGQTEAGTWSTILKTDHLHPYAHRQLPIPADLAALLARAQATARTEFVFVNTRGKAYGDRVAPKGVELHARAIAQDLGLPFVNPVGYRHTFASVCRHNAMPYEQLAKLMGHANTSQIIKTYGHPVADVTAPDLDRYLAG